ncbi:nuclear pore complex protein NUP43 [Tanacetum coccineum]
MEDHQTLKQIHHLPHSTYITTLRYLPPLSTTPNRHVLTSTFNTDTNTPSLTLHSLNPKPHSQTPSFNPTSSFSPSSRITSLKTSHQQNPLIAAATLTGSVHILSVAVDDSSDAVFDSEISIPEKIIHDGGIGGMDMGESGEGCVSCGEDGRVNLISVGESGLDYRRVVDGKGLVGYSAVKWASGSEFVTGGFGNLVQWWDLRRSGGAGPVSQFKGNW